MDIELNITRHSSFRANVVDFVVIPVFIIFRRPFFDLNFETCDASKQVHSREFPMFAIVVERMLITCDESLTPSFAIIGSTVVQCDQTSEVLACL